MSIQPQTASEGFVAARRLDAGWTCVSAPAPAFSEPPPGAGWRPISLPVRPAAPEADALDHWFRIEGGIPPGSLLEFQGLATLSEVWLDGRPLAQHGTMFRPLLVPVPAGGACLEICCRALQPDKAKRRPRWRNRLAPGETLRSHRTSWIGRMASTGGPIIGPYRPILLHPPGAAPRLSHLQATLRDGVGVIDVKLTGPGVAAMQGAVTACGHRAPLQADGNGLSARLTISNPPLWWPHTHGHPALIDVHAEFNGHATRLGQVGFRTIDAKPDGGFGLIVNGVPVFCRGALWTGGDPAAARTARDAGMTMLRIPGYLHYEDSRFFEICDELGMLVWQDFMFARADYPDDAAFLEEARAEARHVLSETARHPSLAVLCGGHEATQSAAMSGRPAQDWRHPLFDDVLPAVAAELRPDVPYVPNAPCGDKPEAELPFASSARVAHYFGIGGYLRPLSDAAGVRFAAACLAFANPEDPHGCRSVSLAPGDAAWRQAVPRDLNATWDFDDVRDHYVAALFGHDPALLRRTDPDRWLAVGRAAVAIAMQTAFATWRADPHCGGALALSFQDRVPGPGWGLVGHDGRPKTALHAVAAMFQPTQALLVNAGLNGIAVHLLNEAPEPRLVRLVLHGLDASGAVHCLADAEQTLSARSALARSAADLMGRFQDLAGAWQFGPAPYAVLGATLTDARTGASLSETVIFPSSPNLPQDNVGLEAAISETDPWELVIQARRFAQFVMIDAGPFIPERNHQHIWPGEIRRIRLAPGADAKPGDQPSGSVSALNGTAAVHFAAAA